MTPNAVQEVKDHQSASCTQPSKGNEVIESIETRNIVTRLRSGVISPVNYFPPISSGRSLMRPCCGGSEKSRKKNRGKLDVFERVLRRHSSPIKPCTSYSFFVMATWGVIKSSSFGETRKQLGRMWCQLPQTEKRVCIAISLSLSLSLIFFNHEQFSFLLLVYFGRKRELKYDNMFL